MKILRTYKDQKQFLSDKNKVNHELGLAEEELKRLRKDNGGIGFNDKTRTITYLPHKNSRGEEITPTTTFKTQKEYQNEKNTLKGINKTEIKNWKRYHKSLKLANSGKVKKAALRETLKKDI